MENEICLICDLIASAMDFIKSLSMSTSSQTDYEKNFAFISKSYEVRGLSQYDRVIMDGLVSETESLFSNGEISPTTRKRRLRAIKILNEIHDTGEISWHRYTEAPTAEIPEYFSRFIEGYLCSCDLHDRTRGNISTILVHFCRFLSDRGVLRFENLDHETVRDYLAYAYPGHTRSMGNVIYCVRSFLRHVSDSGVGIDPKAFLLLTHPAAPDRTIKPVISKEDIAKLLNSVDRSKAPGKRDYAILVLGVYTGLRAVDIINLKRSDVFWKERELRITQHKTGKALTVPLEDNAANAMADYILHERPETADCDFIFITIEAPLRPIKRTSYVISIFDRALKKAGIEHVKGDGKTFHGLRRTLATGMLSEGTPVTTVSQTLGHGNIESTKQYISVDMTGLRRCALSFDAIGGERK